MGEMGRRKKLMQTPYKVRKWKCPRIQLYKKLLKRPPNCLPTNKCVNHFYIHKIEHSLIINNQWGRAISSVVRKHAH